MGLWGKEPPQLDFYLLYCDTLNMGNFRFNNEPYCGLLGGLP